MQKDLGSMVSALLEGKVFEPLRREWPELYGHIVKIRQKTYAVHVYPKRPERLSEVLSHTSHHPHDQFLGFKQIPDAVDRIFADLSFSDFVRHRKIGKDFYTFWLVQE